MNKEVKSCICPECGVECKDGVCPNCGAKCECPKVVIGENPDADKEAKTESDGDPNAPVIPVYNKEAGGAVPCDCTIEKFFGTIQQSVVESWQLHLQTNKYSEHIALNEYYDDALDLVDDIIEDWIGVHGKPANFECTIFAKNFGDSVGYFTELEGFVKKNRECLFTDSEPEILSDIDALLSLIDKTLYKLKQLTESNDIILKFDDFMTQIS